jgi:hypothetical protein
MIVEALKLVRDAIEQGVDLNLIGAKHILDQAIADLEKQDKFCDDNCVWTDHHKDCVRSDIKQKPLTVEQIDDLHGEANRGFCIEREDYFKAFRDAEAAHGITSDIKKS